MNGQSVGGKVAKGEAFQRSVLDGDRTETMYLQGTPKGIVDDVICFFKAEEILDSEDTRTN